MIKRLISEFSSYVILLFGILLIFMNLELIAIFLFIIWYCLFGMVGMAFSYSTRGDVKRSDFFLKVSIPITLLPFRKAYYYWIKAANVILADSTRVSEAFEIAQKVNIDNLYTDNNKCMFFSFFAALLNDLGDKKMALKYVEMAQQLPHREFFDETLEKLKKEINE